MSQSENEKKMPISSVIEEADKLVAKGQFHNAYQFIKVSLRTYDDVELLWRYAQACFLCVYYVNNKPSKEYCERYFTEGMNASKKAIEKNPNHANSLTWYCILWDEHNNLKGFTERFKNISELYDLLMKSQKIDPNNYLTESSLGIWHYIVTEAYNTKPELLKGTKYTGKEFSYELGLKHMLKCEELAPMRSVITLEYLAKCYARLGQKEKSKDYCLKVLNYPADHAESKEAKKEISGLLKTLT
ncbi:Protein FAM82B [Schistosoma japonicum]|nr:Protein FAM82B [Schistosoma japonicum]